MALIQKHGSLATVARVLVAEYAVSTRQAYRYIQAAQRARKPVPIPEEKAPFTVKLPRGLIGDVHDHAAHSGQTLSEVVDHSNTQRR